MLLFRHLQGRLSNLFFGKDFLQRQIPLVLKQSVGLLLYYILDRLIHFSQTLLKFDLAFLFLGFLLLLELFEGEGFLALLLADLKIFSL